MESGDIEPVEVSVDISWTGDLPPEYVDRPAHEERPVDLSTTAGVERPAFERYELDVNRVEARVWRRAKGPPVVGRVTDASVTGMWVEVKKPFAIRTAVSVTMVVPGGYSATFSGRVVRSTGTGMAVHMRTDDSTWQFRSSFIELSRREGSAPHVVIKKSDRGRPKGLDKDVTRLGAMWQDVLDNMDGEDVHQTFIKSCLDARRLEFALERYRELRGGPDDEVASRYLVQLGTMLGFISLERKKDLQNPWQKKLTTIGVVVAFLVVLLVLGQLVIAQLKAG